MEEEIGMTGGDEMKVVIDLWEKPSSVVAFLFVFWRWQPTPDPQQHPNREIRRSASFSWPAAAMLVLPRDTGTPENRYQKLCEVTEDIIIREVGLPHTRRRSHIKNGLKPGAKVPSI